MERCRTGELSRLFEIDRTTLNYYVKKGLIQPEVEGNKYHRYSFSDSMALAFIRYYRGLGFSTEEIEELLCRDDNSRKLEKVDVKMQEVEDKIRFLQFQYLLLENLRETLGVISKLSDGLMPIHSDPYYFIRKTDIENDPDWMELFRATPFVEFDTRYDSKMEKAAVPDLFSHSGISVKEIWLKQLGITLPEKKAYYPSVKKYLAHYYLPAEEMEEALSLRVSETFKTVSAAGSGIKLAEEFVFYLLPDAYRSETGGFECICLFDTLSVSGRHS